MINSTSSLPKRLAELLHHSKFVSFDIFDTAVLRTVQRPVDLFILVNEYYKKINGRALSFDYAAIRIQSEKGAREIAWKNKGAVEITLDEIYEFMVCNFRIDHSTAEILKRVEIELEINSCIQNSFIYSVYKCCLDTGKTVLFLSDMYLPIDIVDRILKKTGYNDFHKIYLSSMHKATKSTGMLYELLLKELSCEPREITHIGDNYESDIKMAQKYGIKTYFYEKCIDRAYRAGEFRRNSRDKFILNGLKIEESLYRAMISNKFYATREDNEHKTKNNFWYVLGYKCAGILFYGFTTWLIEQAIKDQIEKVYFLSRDGYIMKKVYDLLSPYFKESPPSEYLYASRRALNIPSIIELDNNTLDFLVSGTSILSVEQFLRRIGFDPEIYTQEIKAAGFYSKYDKVITGSDYSKLRKLFFLMSDDIKEKAAQERRFLFEYFKEIGIFDLKNIGLVDIGWHGTLQYSIDRIVKLYQKEINLKGYYLGTWSKARELFEKGLDMKAYLCEFGIPEKYHDILKLCVEIFEFIHLAPHGSVIYFDRINGKIEPVFDKNDCDYLKIEKATILHEGAQDFIRDFLISIKPLGLIKISKELALKPIYRVLSNPTSEEAVNLGDLEHAEGFGDIYLKRFIAKPPSLIRCIFNPFNFVRGYKQAFWKIGYIKRFFYKSFYRTGKTFSV